MKPLCFVIMPFGKKLNSGGNGEIDFDEIYKKAIEPAIEAAEMEPIRADEERIGGIIHKPMFERLILCDYVVADLTTANANVFYELGVRHAVRPHTTQSIFAEQQQIPFDVNFLRALPYQLVDGGQLTQDAAEALKASLTASLTNIKKKAAADEPPQDSPVFQLVEGYGPPDISRLKTDVFRERTLLVESHKKKLTAARADTDRAAMNDLQTELGDLNHVDAGVLVDLFLSYRDIEAYEDMCNLYDEMSATMKRVVLVREQYGFALNRLKRREEALKVLQGVLDEQGPTSETYGLIGRIYKDWWKDAESAGEQRQARGYLAKAIDHYIKGFEADARDSYPGINAVTLLEAKGDQAALDQQAALLPVVRFAAQNRLKSVNADYWDLATLLELAVLANDPKEADERLDTVATATRDSWKFKTTADNFEVIKAGREKRGMDMAWLGEIIEELRTLQRKYAPKDEGTTT